MQVNLFRQCQGINGIQGGKQKQNVECRVGHIMDSKIQGRGMDFTDNWEGLVGQTFV